MATVDIAQEAAERSVGRDNLRAELRRTELTISGIMLGAMVAIAGVAITITELI